MLHGQYFNPITYHSYLAHPVWNTAFTWIQTNGHVLPDGEHSIASHDIYANIHTVQTVAQKDTFYEVHEEYIDIHYCLSGGEAIAYEPIGDLKEKEVNKLKDYQLFLPTEKFSICNLQTNSFAIFFPKELHMPKLQNGIDSEVRKVVVKIRVGMLSV